MGTDMKTLWILALCGLAYGQMGSGGYHPPLGGGVSGGAVGGASNLTTANAVICVASAGTAKECVGGSTTSTVGGAIAPQSNQANTAFSIQTGGLQVSAAASSFGATAYPYPGRILSVYKSVSAFLGYGLGVDIHPDLVATANNDALRGIWISPDSYTDGSFTGVTHGGIHNADTLEQVGKIVGSVPDAGVQVRLLDIGQDSTVATTYDLKSLGGARLYGITLLPSLLNGAAGGNTVAGMYGIDMKVHSLATNANTLTEQMGIHIQAGTVDGNTTLTNKYGLYIENQAAASPGGTINEGIHNVGTINQVGAATFGSTLNNVTLTTPATAATLTLANNSSLITSGAFAATITASATSNFTLPAGSTTGVAGGNNITTAGAIPYVSASGIITQDQTANNQFFWDPINHRFGAGTITPATRIEAVDGTFTATHGSAMTVRDPTAQATGTGGGIGFWGNYTDGGSTTIGGAIRTYKINGTTGNFGFGLKFFTRLNGSGGVAANMTLDDGGNLAVVGSVTPATHGTTNNCSSAASPAVCSSASAGSIVVAAAATTVVVNTTAVTANSQIFLMYDSSLGTKLGVTCNATEPALFGVTARTAATSFTITATAPITNPACFSYFIVN